MPILIFLLVLLSCSLNPFSLLAVNWTPATLLSEQTAIVKTTLQIQEEVKEKSNSASIKIKEKKTSPGKSFDVPYLNFTAATYEESGVVPPDAMGVVGPSQFILAANGRIRSFDKESGKADGAIDIATSLFFQPVSKGAFTTDSRIRYDRFSDRWVILILALATPVRIVLAMSDSGIITPQTKWSFYFIEPYQDFAPDYPTLGIDRHALYIGANIMKGAAYHTSDGYVIPKKPLLEGKLRLFAFQNIVDPIKFEGPLSPQGVDNFDPDSTEGYFIGNDGNGKRLMLRRVKDPGEAPAISTNIVIPVIDSASPLPVPQKGSIQLDKFFLQGFDERLSCSHVRGKMLYTSYNAGVNNKGETLIAHPTRNGCLWFQINIQDREHPFLQHTGVLYQSSTQDDKEERYYWMPGVMTNGLNTMVMGCSTSGDHLYADAAFALRYSDDPPASIRKPIIYTKSDAVYVLGSPPFKTLRYGEYTQPSVDPTDDMTLWSIAEYTLAPTNWGLQAIRIPAAPPAKIVKITSRPLQKVEGVTDSYLLTIRGKRENGSAYFDPGEGFSKHLKVEIEGAQVISTQWISPTRIRVLIKSEKAVDDRPRNIKITNPDGQFIETSFLIT